MRRSAVLKGQTAFHHPVCMGTWVHFTSTFWCGLTVGFCCGIVSAFAAIFLRIVNTSGWTSGPRGTFIVALRDFLLVTTAVFFLHTIWRHYSVSVSVSPFWTLLHSFDWPGLTWSFWWTEQRLRWVLQLICWGTTAFYLHLLCLHRHCKSGPLPTTTMVVTHPIPLDLKRKWGYSMVLHENPPQDTTGFDSNAYKQHLQFCWNQVRKDNVLCMPWDLHLKSPGDVFEKSGSIFSISGQMPPIPASGQETLFEKDPLRRMRKASDLRMAHGKQEINKWKFVTDKGTWQSMILLCDAKSHTTVSHHPSLSVLLCDVKSHTTVSHHPSLSVFLCDVKSHTSLHWVYCYVM